MKLVKAINLLIDEYEKAARMNWVRDPVAYALHQVWKKADEFRNESDDRCKDCKQLPKG